MKFSNVLSATNVINISSKNTQTFNWRELLRYKELLFIFAWRDISVKFKQSILGIGWVVIQPLATMVIFSYFFGKVSKIPSQGIPYSVFVLTGLVFWGLFSNIINHSSNSMIDNENIIKKVYFPKIIIPLSSIVSSLPDFMINITVLLIVVVITKTPISIFAPIYIFISFMLTITYALGLGLIFSSANVKFRDVRYALPFVLQLLMFVSPVVFPLDIVSPSNQMVMSLNPLSSAIDLSRHIFMENGTINIPLVLVSTLSTFCILFLGILLFQKTERFFADLV